MNIYDEDEVPESQDVGNDWDSTHGEDVGSGDEGKEDDDES